MTLNTAAVDRLLAPFRAVRRDREFLWLLDDAGKMERCLVCTGLRITDRVEILEGLEPGERVVTRNLSGLTQGKPVRIVADSPKDSL